MSGLSLINTYSSDSDEEEEEKEKANSKSLPLPQSILTWQGVEHHSNIIDKPDQHNGRARTFKHERGNWATLIYIDYKPSDVVYSCIKTILSQQSIEGNTCFEEFHISLSRTLILKFHWIEAFVDSLKKLCERTSQFQLKLLNFKVYCNDEKTRTFLGLECYNNDGILNQFIRSLNILLTEYNLPLFYEDPSYHISLSWILGDKRKEFMKLLPSLTLELNKFLYEHVEENYIRVNRLQCKIGNKLYNFKLR